MGLIGRLQAETLIKAPADNFHEVFASRPHHVPNICPGKIQKVDLHEGDWGKPGSVTEWSYTLDGKSYKAKHIVHPDFANKSVTFSLIGGELTEEFKSYKAVVQMIPKGNDTWMHWTIDYEKLHKDIPAPVHILGLLVSFSEDIDDHLVQALKTSKTNGVVMLCENNMRQVRC